MHILQYARHMSFRGPGGTSPENFKNYHTGVGILKYLASRHAGPYSYIAAIKQV